MARHRAETRASELLEEFGADGPPVPVEKLAEWCGAVVRYEAFSGEGEVSGVLIRDGDRIVVGVNQRHAENRQRFTIAHELGHLLLHPGQPLIVDPTVRINRRDATSSTATDAQEIEANQFAAALLMPAELVRSHARRLSVQDGIRGRSNLVKELATTFAVSPEAMQYRLVNLGMLTASI